MSWLSPCGVRIGGKGFPAVNRFEKTLGARVHDIRVGGIGPERGVVERPLNQGRLCVHNGPCLARIVRSVEPAAGKCLDQRVDAIRFRVRHREIGFADELSWQASGDPGELFPSIRALEEAAIARSADDRPRLPLQPRHPRVHDAGVARLDFDIHGTNAIVDVQDLAPGLAAVIRLEHPTLGILLEGVAVGGHPHHVGIGRMDTHGADLTGVGEPGELPCGPAIGRLVNASTGGHIASNAVGSGADVDDVGIGISDGDRAHRPKRNPAVCDGCPRRTAVRRAEEPAARDAHVEGARLRGHTGHRGHAPAARRPDEPVLHALEERGIDRRHQRRGRAAWLPGVGAWIGHGSGCQQEGKQVKGTTHGRALQSGRKARLSYWFAIRGSRFAVRVNQQSAIAISNSSRLADACRNASGALRADRAGSARRRW